MDIEFSIFRNLSNELINKIINYTDILVYRNGKYMNRISKEDKRYLLLEKIPKPVKIFGNSNSCIIYIRILKYNVDIPYGYILTYSITDNTLQLCVKFCYRETDGYDRYTRTKTKENYIFDSNSRWKRLVYYQM